MIVANAMILAICDAEKQREHMIKYLTVFLLYSSAMQTEIIVAFATMSAVAVYDFTHRFRETTAAGQRDYKLFLAKLFSVLCFSVSLCRISDIWLRPKAAMCFCGQTPGERGHDA